MNKNDLTLEQLLVLQSEMRHAEKSLALAYFMLLGGHLGVHRFYLKRYVSGTIQLILFLAATLSPESVIIRRINTRRKQANAAPKTNHSGIRSFATIHLRGAV